MKYLSLIIVLASILAFCGCNRNDVKSCLDDVETYIMDYPDSALAVLETMDRNLLKKERDRARHALLHAMALDKNYIDVCDDSIARVAVEYYSKHGPGKYEARALYYLGIAYYYQREYAKAIIEFTKGERVAEKHDSLYWGMIKSFQAYTYDLTYNEEEAVKCLLESHRIFSELSEHYYINASELRLMQTYYDNGEYKKSEDFFNRLMADSTLNEELRTSAILFSAFTKGSSNDADYSAACHLYDMIFSDDPSALSYSDYWVWAYSLNMIGDRLKSASIIDQLSLADSSVTADYWMYRLEKSNENIDSALAYLESATTKHNEEVTKALHQSLAMAQRDYYETQSELYAYSARNRMLSMICVIFISLFLIGTISILSAEFIRSYKKEKEGYLRLAEEIKRQLEHAKNEEYPALKRKFLALYSTKFETIGYLLEQYSLSNGKKNAERIIYNKVSSIVDDFKADSENREQFESIINNDLDNLMQNLRSEMPKLKEIDYSIFSYMVLGFDSTTISHLLNMTINTIYIRKSRMRQHIEDAAPLHKDDFLMIFNS